MDKMNYEPDLAALDELRYRLRLISVIRSANWGDLSTDDLAWIIERVQMWGIQNEGEFHE